MATLHLTAATTVADLRKEFNEAFGSQVKVYIGNKGADMSSKLGEAGLSKSGEMDCANTMTVDAFIAACKSDWGLKVKVYTCDEWVAALDALTLEQSGQVKKAATKADMEKMVGTPAMTSAPAKAETKVEKTTAPAAQKEAKPTASSEEEALKARIAELEKELKKQKEVIQETPTITKSDKIGIKSVEGDIFADQMVLIKGGTFEQVCEGSKLIKDAYDEYPNDDKRFKPIHHDAEYKSFVHKREVTISDFQISKYLVTNKQWRSIMNPNSTDTNKNDWPVCKIDMSSIREFLNKLPHPAHYIYDLPTEAQWEFATLDTNKSLTECILDEDHVATDICTVGSKKPNKYGLYDLVGNVAEICRDDYKVDLGETSVIDPITKDSYSPRILRGRHPHYILERKGGYDLEQKLAGFRVVLRQMTTEELEKESFEQKLKEYKNGNNLNIPEGALSGLFSVSPSKMVRFAKGNLWYNPQKFEWKFAEHQWNTITENIESINSNYDGWIDIFGFGTSGYMGYLPTECSRKEANYVKENITDSKYDWGKYNPISNGGNKEGLWRTLTAKECGYLLGGRPNANKLSAYATVNGVKGWIIFPDNFYDQRIPFPFKPNGNNEENEYSLAQWQKIEDYGAVFFPEVMSLREGRNCVNYTPNDIYWTSTYYGSCDFGGWTKPLCAEVFYRGGCSHSNIYSRLPVRLVQDLVL